MNPNKTGLVRTKTIIAGIMLVTLCAPIDCNHAAHPTIAEPPVIAPAQKPSADSSAYTYRQQAASASDVASDGFNKANLPAEMRVSRDTVDPTNPDEPSPARIQDEDEMLHDFAIPPHDQDDPPLDPLVSVAIEDLAQRLGIREHEIEILEARNVVWPDAGLGCPQPGAVYAKIRVDGLLIRLRAGGRMYFYHSGGTRDPFLCEETSRLVPKAEPRVDEFVPPPGYEID